jgi:hypothetical protein
MAGRPQFFPRAREVWIVDDLGRALHVFGYDQLKGTAWGKLYERHVGLHYEALGYTVQYRGLRLGYFDSGIDLDCEGPDERLFIQCKFTSSRLGPQRIEQLLYSASGFLNRAYTGTRLNFALIVPSIRIAFGDTRSRNRGDAVGMRRFLYVNERQNRVRVRVVEVPMQFASP